MVLSQPLINLLVIAAEIGLLIIVFVLINFLLKNILFNAAKASKSRRLGHNIQKLYRRLRLMNGLIFICAAVGVLAVNLWLLYQGENLKNYSYQLLQNASSSFWEGIALGLGKSLGLLAIMAIANFLIQHWLHKLCEQAKKFEEITANDHSIEIFLPTYVVVFVVDYGFWPLFKALLF